MAVTKNLNVHKPVLKVSMDSSSETSSSSDESQSDIDETNESNGTLTTDKTNDNIEDSSDDDNQDADVESDSSTSEDDNKDGLITNEGWADSVAKILSSNKPKNKKSLVLSRAKKYSAVVKVEKESTPAFEVIGDVPAATPVVKNEESITSEPPAKRVKQSKPSLRVKPNILEKDREKLLSKIATKGVVQLFNAVRNQQKTLQKEMDRNDLSEGKKEKILKKFDKRTFLDTLMGQSKSIIVDEKASATKNEVKDEEDTPQWSALRDDFMMGAKMKDWEIGRAHV